MSSVVDLLYSLENPDRGVQRRAEAVIFQVRNENLGAFLTELVRVVRDENINERARQQALILLKNSVAFNARDESNKKTLETRWNTLDGPTREQVKKEVLNTLGSPVSGVRFVAALVVANLARLELPRQQWPELLGSLFKACKSEGHVETAITTLGYICEESNTCSGLADVLQQHCTRILDCVVTGMRKEMEEVCYQSTNALCNAVTFIQGNMANTAERDFIIQTVCANCINHEKRTMVKALECLVRIAFEYYDKIEAYMPTLFTLTVQSIQGENEETALQGFQFWTTICEVEAELIEEAAGTEVQHYAAKAAPHILPVCLQALLRQEGEQTDEDWNTCTAGGICLRGFAQVLKNVILPYVMPFITGHVEDTRWRYRDAALTAFGGIMDGPETRAVKDIITQAMPHLMHLAVTDPHNTARESSVWSISRVAHFHASIIFDSFLDKIVHLVTTVYTNTPSIANKTCSILQNLCLELETGSTIPVTNPLSPYFVVLVNTLLRCMDLPNAQECNFRGAAQETLNSLLSCAAEDVLPKVSELIPEFVERIDKLATQIASQAQNSCTQELQLTQGLFCGSLQHICQKLGRRLKPESTTSIMRACIGVLRQSQNTGPRKLFFLSVHWLR